MNQVRGAMNLVGWLYVLAGAAFAAVSFWPGGLTALLALVQLGGGPASAGAALMTAVGGGLTAGFGGAMIAAARAKEHDLAASVRAFSVGLLLWFLIDSGASIGHGAWRNAGSNTLFLALGLAPLALLRRALDGGGAAGPASRG